MNSDLTQIPSTFWRVSAKALIYDADNRLLVFMDKHHEWEIPGGGWEHEETFEECIIRELAEEVRVGVTGVGEVAFCYPSKTLKGHFKLGLAAKVVIDNSPIVPSDDDLVEARFVTKDEFLKLLFQPGEHTVKEYVGQIWP
jgi:8-oxo-dGTP pyrophosphatase MutT (NUDIX family)